MVAIGKTVRAFLSVLLTGSHATKWSPDVVPFFTVRHHVTTFVNRFFFMVHFSFPGYFSMPPTLHPSLDKGSNSSELSQLLLVACFATNFAACNFFITVTYWTPYGTPSLPLTSFTLKWFLSYIRYLLFSSNWLLSRDSWYPPLQPRRLQSFLLGFEDKL